MTLCVVDKVKIKDRLLLFQKEMKSYQDDFSQIDRSLLCDIT